MRARTIEPHFVEYIPRQLAEGALYISEKYKTASHLCACGCGEKVVTPLSPVDWRLHKVGGKVSLYPSIGNWNYACRSHYWIRDNLVLWEGALTQQQIAMVQARDRADKVRYVAQTNQLKTRAPETVATVTPKAPRKPHWTQTLLKLIKSWFSW